MANVRRVITLFRCPWCSTGLSSRGWCSQRCLIHHQKQDPDGYESERKEHIRLDALNKKFVRNFWKLVAVSVGILVFILWAISKK